MEAIEKTKRLYSFIKELCQLKSSTVLNIKEQKWERDIESIPDYEDYVSISYKDLVEDAEEIGDNYALRVQKPEFLQCPKPERSFKDWLVKGWDDFSKIASVREYKIISDNTELEEKEYFEDDPARVEDYTEWLHLRDAWAEKQKSIEAVRNLFTELYTWHVDLERDSESIEMMCGTGFIKVKNSPEIYHPLLLHRMATQFDPDKNEMKIIDVDVDSEFYTSPLNGVAGLNLQGIQEDVLNNSYHPLDRNETPDFLRVLSHKISPDCKFAENEEQSFFGKSDEYVIFPKIVFFVRKKIDGTARMIDVILENISNTEFVPPFIQEIVSGGEIPLSVEDASPTIEQQLAEVGGEDVDILLSKEANREQLEIARRIENYNAVLVQGPPGTGKTHTIANLLGHFLAEGKSVLVTSYTKKALTVLKEKVVPGLQNLCVSVLDDSREDMEKAIEGIMEYTSKNNSFVLKRKIAQADAERKDIISLMGKVRRKLFSIKYQECNTIVVNGEDISPSKAAQFVSQNAEELSYIPGRIAREHSLPLTLDELTDLYASNALISSHDEAELNLDIPSDEELLSNEELQKISDKINIANNCFRKIQSEKEYHLDYDRGDDSATVTRNEFSIKVERLSEIDIVGLQSLIEKFPKFEDWMIFAAIDGKRGGAFKSRWNLLIEKINATKQLSESFVGDRFGKEVTFKDLGGAKFALDVYSQMKVQYEEKGTLKTFGLFMPPKYTQALQYVSINGKTIEDADDCNLVIKELELIEARNECARYWGDLLVGHNVPDFMALDTKEPEFMASKWIPDIEKALALYKSIYAKIQGELEKLGLSDDEIFGIEKTESDEVQTRKIVFGIVETLPVLLNLIEQEKILIHCQDIINEAVEILSKGKRIDSSVCYKAREAIKAVDLDSYKRYRHELCELFKKYTLQKNRNECLCKLEVVAPEWALAIKNRNGMHGGPEVPPRVFDAWKWKQYVAALEELSREPYEELQNQSVELSKRYRKCTAKLAELRAWYNLALRTEQNIELKQALQGWALTVRRIGKGTGKSAPKFRAEARRQMAKCQKAVPAWIMPMSKAVETLDPRKNMFDVIIVDEASQSDISSLAVAYMAKKIVVVGDDRQVSPMAIGVKEEEINSLASIYIKDVVPNWVLYNSKTSLYDIAKTTFQSLMLKEHFRCVPDIIGFSNWLSYDGKIKVLRDDSDSILLPAIACYRVDGDTNRLFSSKVNEAESKRIITLMKACMEQPEYEKKTFGIISLSGDAQVKNIQRLMYKFIDEKDLDKRRVLCGNAANFQGDERDVIFLSMVDERQDNGPLRLLESGVDDSIKKRYNVAVSRARDQLWIIHSLDPENDLKENDIRKRLLSYARNPKDYAHRLDSVENDSESPFEKEVALALTTRGYKVYQQWKVGSYRIDMVVEYNKKRIALECDGERFHSSESQIRSDMERQTILERIGWRFIRIRGSEYYYNKEKAIEKLIAQLDLEGIQPTHEQKVTEIKELTPLQQRVQARADELMDLWFPKEETEVTEENIPIIWSLSNKGEKKERNSTVTEPEPTTRYRRRYSRETVGQLSFSDLYGSGFNK